MCNMCFVDVVQNPIISGTACRLVLVADLRMISCRAQQERLSFTVAKQDRTLCRSTMSFPVQQEGTVRFMFSRRRGYRHLALEIKLRVA